MKMGKTLQTPLALVLQGFAMGAIPLGIGLMRDMLPRERLLVPLQREQHQQLEQLVLSFAQIYWATFNLDLFRVQVDFDIPYPDDPNFSVHGFSSLTTHSQTQQ